MSFTSGSVGGEYAHCLSETEMPKHFHFEKSMVKGYSGWPTINVDEYGVMIDCNSNNYVEPGSQVTATITNSFAKTDNAGGSAEHNNIQPYTTVSFWKRIS